MKIYKDKIYMFEMEMLWIVFISGHTRCHYGGMPGVALI